MTAAAVVVLVDLQLVDENLRRWSGHSRCEGPDATVRSMPGARPGWFGRVRQSAWRPTSRHRRRIPAPRRTPRRAPRTGQGRPGCRPVHTSARLDRAAYAAAPPGPRSRWACGAFCRAYLRNASASGCVVGSRPMQSIKTESHWSAHGYALVTCARVASLQQVSATANLARNTPVSRLERRGALVSAGWPPAQQGEHHIANEHQTACRANIGAGRGH